MRGECLFEFLSFVHTHFLTCPHLRDAALLCGRETEAFCYFERVTFYVGIQVDASPSRFALRR